MENSESVLLRQRAEDLLKSRISEQKSEISEVEALKRIHELEVTQIELELQNDELIRAKNQDEKNRKLIHNVEVQQIELELQNEELILARMLSEESAQKYLELYDFAPTAYFTLSKNAEIEELNLTAAGLFGKERTRLLKSSFGFFVNKETRPIFNLFLENIFSGLKKQTCEITLQTDSYKPIHVHLSGRIDTKGDSCLVNAVDITERIVTERELKETKLLLQSSIESQKEMIIISIDKNYNYLYFNQFHKSIMADLYGNEVKTGMNILENISTDVDRSIFKANCDRALAGENHISINEYGDLKRDYYEARYNPIINDNEEIIGATIFSENITNRILSETKLQESDLFVKSIIDTFTAHIVVLNQNGVILAVNEAWKKFANDNDSPNHTDFLGTNYLQTCKNAYNKGDINALVEMQGIESVINGSQTQYKSEYPCHSPNEERWFSLTVLPIYNSDHGVVLIHENITESKMAEDKLRNSELHLKKALLSSTELIESVTTAIDYEKMNNTIMEISGAICSVYNVYNEKEAVFTTKAIGGIKNIHKKASSYLGVEIINKEWKLDPALEAKINKNTFHELGTFNELVEDYIPKSIVKIIEKTYNLGNVIIVRVAINNVTVGDVTLLFAKGESIRNKEIVELYANQVGLFIKRIQTEATIRESEEALNKVLQASAEFIDTSSDTVDYGKMTDNILAMTNAKCAVFNLFDENGIDIVTKAVTGFNDFRKIATTLFGYNAIDKKWKYEPELIDKIKNNIINRFKSLYELNGTVIPKPIAKLIEITFNFGEVAIVKINLNDKVIGYFTLYFSKGKTLQNSKILELYANQVGLYIKRKQAEVALKSSEQMFQNILENFPGDVFWKDTQATFVGCNSSFAKTVGLTKQTDIIQKTDFDLLSTHKSADDFRADDFEVINTGISKLHIEKMRRLSDGSVFWSDTNKIPLRDFEGHIIGILGVVTDITERKLAQNALQESEQMLKYVLNNFPGVVFWKDEKSRYLGCNQLFAIGAGLNDSSEIKLKNDFDLPWAETEASNYIANDIQVMNSGKEMLHLIEKQHQADNQVVWFDTSKIPLYNSENELIGVLGVAIDITLRKQAETDLQKLNEVLEDKVQKRTIKLLNSNNSLQQTENKFRTVADFTYGWEYWSSDVGEIIYMSPSVERITGYKVADFVKDPELLGKIIHPSDKNLWENHNIDQHNNLHSKKHRELNFRIITKNNEVCWIGHVCKCVYIDGKYHGMRVSNRDITQRIKAENELLKVTVVVEERERNRFSSELHDTMGPLLSTIKLYFQWLSETDDVEKIKFITEKGNHSIDVAIQTIREISHGLSTLNLNKFGYVDILYDFCERINDTQKVKIDFTYNSKDKFGVFLETTLYRISTELIKNTLTHANASQIKIDFHYYLDKNIVVFTYSDNGIGFDFDEIDKSGKSLGLLSIRQRISSAKGKINFKSKTGNKMKVSIELPVDNESN